MDGDFFPEDPTKTDFINRVPCLLGQDSKDTDLSSYQIDQGSARHSQNYFT